MIKGITYGTFDLFHKGHYNILKRAKEHCDYLIVAVTGETYDAERGKLSVQDSLSTRIENVRKTGFADKIIVEEYLGQKIQDIIKYNIDVFIIGSDWKGKFDHLSKYCQVLYLERTKDISSTQLREKRLNIYRLGIATDQDLSNPDFVNDIHVVSGIHVESVFAEDVDLAGEICDQYELSQAFDDFQAFLEDVDVVFLMIDLKKREAYIRQALLAGKHVISDVPYSLDHATEMSLEALAEQNGLVLLRNMNALYLQTFGQLLWMVRGNIIGDIVSLKCSISQDCIDNFKGDILEIAYRPICMIIKIMGYNYENALVNVVYNDSGNAIYCTVDLKYQNSTAYAEISTGIEIDCAMTVNGTKGVVQIPDEWWRVGYFKIKKSGETRYKHYSSNFDGYGTRYVIQTFIQEVKSGTRSNLRVTAEEAKAINNILVDLQSKTGNITLRL